MPTINLKYGKTHISLGSDNQRFQILGTEVESAPLSDAEIGAKFDAPINSAPLDEIVKTGESVLIVVPDATRQSACGQIVNLLVRRLIANGTMPFDINIIFATGIHRAVTESEKIELLTPFIAQRVKVFNHNARDLMQIINFGETADGIPIELNRALGEYDHTIIVGAITFHYFAGFTGGRKLICPGLASSRTIAATHKLAFDCATKTRREGVELGVLDNNPVHEAFVAVASKMPPSFAINTVVNDAGEAVEIFCGDWKASHRAACDFYSRKFTIKVEEKRDLVIVSAGGVPFDTNMIQAHKSLDMAARVCSDGGTIVLLAECADGLGRKDFLDWFAAENADALAEKLCEKYQVNGQTAWNLLQIAEKFDVRILTDLPETETRRMRLTKIYNENEILADINKNGESFILPFGAKFSVSVC